MLTLQSLFPKLDFTKPYYDDENCFIGISDYKYYFVSKLNSTILIYAQSKILTFIDNVLVDKRRLSCREDKNKTNETDFLKEAYKHDCCTHLNKDISKKIRYFMRYANSYDIRIFDTVSIYNDTKFLLIIDESDKIPYHAIVRNNNIYFNNPKKDLPLRHSLLINNFYLRDYGEYTSPSGEIINIFQSQSRLIESHYYPDHKHYIIDGLTVTGDYDLKKSSHFYKKINVLGYDEEFIFNFVFENEIIHEPIEKFLETLLDMSILQADEQLTLEHIYLYEMAMI